jgi:hypothetical protein
MFEEVGIPMHLACSASTPADIQWMVKAGYGLALIDQISSLDSQPGQSPVSIGPSILRLYTTIGPTILHCLLSNAHSRSSGEMASVRSSSPKAFGQSN